MSTTTRFINISAATKTEEILPWNVIQRILANLDINSYIRILGIVPEGSIIASLVHSFMFRNLKVCFNAERMVEDGDFFQFAKYKGFFFKENHSNPIMGEKRLYCYVTSIAKLNNLYPYIGHVRDVTVSCGGHADHSASDMLVMSELQPKLKADKAQAIQDFLESVPALLGLKVACPSMGFDLQNVERLQSLTLSEECFIGQTESIFLNPRFFAKNSLHERKNKTSHCAFKFGRNWSNLKLLRFHWKLDILDGNNFFLPNLVLASFTECQIAQVTNLNHSNFPKLRALDLSCNNITTITEEIDIPTLRDLSISHNINLNVGNSLHLLSNLLSLSMEHNNMVQIPSLHHFPLLNALYLTGNLLTNIPRSLLQLRRLQSFDMSGNEISVIENLENCTQLAGIGLSQNQITEIRGLDTLADNLEILCLNENPISELKNVEMLKNLRKLYMSECRLLRAGEIYNLKNLEHIDLSRNFLVERFKTKEFPNLKRVLVNYL